MNGGPLVELVLVLFFVFLTMSAIVSTLQEVIAQTFRIRTHTLRHCIRQMLHDDIYGERIYKRFFRHPRIAVPGRSTSQLTTIDPEDFAVAMATAVQPEDSGDDCISELPASILALQDGDLKQRLRLAMPDVFREGANADQIKASVVAWFNASMNKTMEVYRSATRMRLYAVAAAVTVLLNVSPIKIAQDLRAKPELTTAFAAAVPELTNLVSGLSDGAAAKLVGNQRDLDGTQALKAEATSDLSATDVNSLKAILDCTSGRIGLPIGWPWMSEIFAKLEAGKSASNPKACTESLAKAQLDPALNQRLQMLSLASADMAATQKTPPIAVELPPAATAPATAQPAATPQPAASLDATEAAPVVADEPPVDPAVWEHQKKVAAQLLEPSFGPNFDTDPWFMILLGWTIMIVAAGQGAPFWFSLLQRIVSKK